MRTLVFDAPGRVSWHDVPDPFPAPHGALVRPLAVARCDLDAPMAAFGIFPGPFPVGHELVGEVVEVAADVASPSAPASACRSRCRAERARRARPAGPRCARPTAPPPGRPSGSASAADGGAVTDLLAVPHADHLLVPAPDGLGDAALATLPHNAVDAYRTGGPQLAERPGADVLVLAGAVPSIGLYAVAMARALGAGSVRYVDADAERCAAAERLGADVTQLDGAWPRRFDRAGVVVDGTADAAGLSCAVRSTEDLGLLTVVGIVFGEAPLPLLEMYTRGITLHASRADSRRHLPAVLELAASGTFDPLAVPTTTVPFDDAAEAWLAPATKLVLTR